MALAALKAGVLFNFGDEFVTNFEQLPPRTASCLAQVEYVDLVSILLFHNFTSYKLN